MQLFQSSHMMSKDPLKMRSKGIKFIIIVTAIKLIRIAVWPRDRALLYQLHLHKKIQLITYKITLENLIAIDNVIKYK